MAAQRGKVLLLMDQTLGNLVAFTLRHVDYDIENASSIRDALKVADATKPDLVIADYDREPDALQLAAASRARSLPVVAMTRRRDTPVKLAAYDQGAHDIIEVPFTPDEIVARAVAAMRRTRGIRTIIIPKIKVGQLEIDLMSESVSVDGDVFHLTPLQHTLLYLLAGNSGTILTREQIIQDIWGSAEVVESNVVDRHVRDLRAKLRDNWKEPRFLETIAGMGYRFVSADAGGELTRRRAEA